jgi:hypothetical protein
MAYRNFKTIEQAVNAFDLAVEDRPHLFGEVSPIRPLEWLTSIQGQI